MPALPDIEKFGAQALEQTLRQTWEKQAMKVVFTPVEGEMFVEFVEVDDIVRGVLSHSADGDMHQVLRVVCQCDEEKLASGGCCGDTDEYHLYRTREYNSLPDNCMSEEQCRHWVRANAEAVFSVEPVGRRIVCAFGERVDRKHLELLEEPAI